MAVNPQMVRLRSLALQSMQDKYAAEVTGTAMSANPRKMSHVRGLTSEDLAEVKKYIIGWEGFLPHLKPDAGGRSVGYGTNIKNTGHGALIRRTLPGNRASSILAGGRIETDEADKLLDAHLGEYYPVLTQKLKGFDKYPLKTRAAIYSAYHNSPSYIGPKFIEAMNTGNYHEAAAEMGFGHRPSWTDDKGKVHWVDRNVHRRIADGAHISDGFNLTTSDGRQVGDYLRDTFSSQESRPADQKALRAQYEAHRKLLGLFRKKDAWYAAKKRGAQTVSPQSRPAYTGSHNAASGVY